MIVFFHDFFGTPPSMDLFPYCSGTFSLVEPSRHFPITYFPPPTVGLLALRQDDGLNLAGPPPPPMLRPPAGLDLVLKVLGSSLWMALVSCSQERPPTPPPPWHRVSLFSSQCFFSLPGCGDPRHPPPMNRTPCQQLFLLPEVKGDPFLVSGSPPEDILEGKPSPQFYEWPFPLTP